MTKQFKKIFIQTAPNGYALNIDGHEFFYFNEIDLLAGFIAHVGLQQTKEMDRPTLLSGLFASMLGEVYNEGVDSLKKSITRLNNKEIELAKKVDAIEKKLTEVEDHPAVGAKKTSELTTVRKKKQIKPSCVTA